MIKKPKTIAQIATLDQPAPKSNDIRPSFATAMDWLQGRYPELQDAIAARAEVGYQRYNTYLQPSNGRCPSIDGLQETLDDMNYLAQEWVEAMTSNSPLESEIMEDFWAAAAIANRQLKRAMVKNEIDT
jgi:hypothetical protein